ncbi:MAG: DUF5654 family protein [Patescibacteria group bacterium]|nr:DUF5654 family protein [Patescibacteria group bacterium]
MPKNSRKETVADKKLHIELIRQMLTLATSGFGLVAALAWNSLIQEFVNSYVKKWLPANSGIISLLIYAVAITALAVFVTYQLSKLSEKINE